MISITYYKIIIFPINGNVNIIRENISDAGLDGKWVFCRHKERATWEIPGGHREHGEEILKAAKRANAFQYLPGKLFYAGINEMLAELKSACIHTAIVTNKHGTTADKICGTLFGTDGSLLDVCVSAYPRMVLKPAPDELLSLLDRFNAEKDECMYCGDHTIDMTTGKNAGVITVGVTWGFHKAEALRAAGADLIAEKPSDIVGFTKDKTKM